MQKRKARERERERRRERVGESECETYMSPKTQGRKRQDTRSKTMNMITAKKTVAMTPGPACVSVSLRVNNNIKVTSHLP